MFDQLIKDPRLSRLGVSYAGGEVVFHEDEASRDLYFLVEGAVEVVKGQARLARIDKPGAVFGEMSFLLAQPRTATVRALGPARALRVPFAEAEQLVGEHPKLSLEITKLLALRLGQTSQTLFGLKELVDLMADAVVFTDEQGRVVACNQAAQSLYGRSWPAVSGPGRRGVLRRSPGISRPPGPGPQQAPDPRLPAARPPPHPGRAMGLGQPNRTLRRPARTPGHDRLGP